MSNHMYVVKGYHFGFKKRKKRSYPYLDTRKPYYFKTNQHTKHMDNKRVNHVARVSTKEGPANLVVTKIINVSQMGKAVVARAKHLKPVLEFFNGPIRQKWTRHFYNKFMKNHSKGSK